MLKVAGGQVKENTISAFAKLVSMIVPVSPEECIDSNADVETSTAITDEDIKSIRELSMPMAI